MLQSDSALADKVRGASSHAAIAKIATDEGFEITEEHVIAKHELSEAELEAVSGGTNAQSPEHAEAGQVARLPSKVRSQKD